MKRVFKFSFEKSELIVFSFFFIFSWILMSKTFQLTPEGNLRIASKAWSDFAATIPLIRSFSYGANFPPQYPLFSGLPIRYHFVFFFLVGFLEKIGIPLPWALNLLSIISFFLLLFLIYTLSKEIFKSKKVAVISVILFLFNGSFSFLEFFKSHPLALSTFSDIITNISFPSFGPYDGKIVSAFWNLNIFTNQRHLAFAYASFLALILLIYKAAKASKQFTFKKALTLGIAIGLFPFIHLAVFGMMMITLSVFFLIYTPLRRKIFISGAAATLLALPQIIYMGRSQVQTSFLTQGI